MARAKEGKNQGLGSSDQEKILTFPIVGLGSSAGGLEALEAFFKNVPPDSGMAYVIVSHLEPTHTSLLADIISKSTNIRVVQAENETVAQQNEAYVIPPGKYIVIINGTLRLLDRKAEGEPFLPTDYFLRSLAEDRKESAIAVILSGNGSDGSTGIRSIHSNLGLIVIQSPDTAAYDSMPRSAIETGLADYVLPPDEMPGIIFRYFEAQRTKKRPPKAELVGDTDSLHKILSIIKGEMGHDFSLYKKSTITRRIERRMTVHQLENMEQYARYLISNPSEIHLLFEELTIQVTSFFRNSEAFESLKGALRKIVSEHKKDGDSLRAWVAGCSTGEEAYSIAIILRELIDETRKNLQVQIFGSDISKEAINVARSGEYPLAIANDVNEKRLDKYFIKQENGYKVTKNIREMVVFAPHNIIRDPPFIHLDLLTCRNLLIYFEPVLQKRVMETFGSALDSNGILFLGESETINGFEDGFVAIDSKWKIYRRRAYKSSVPTMKVSGTPVRSREAALVEARPVKIPNVSEKAERLLLSEYTPPSLLVDDKNEIVYFHGRTSKYLEHTPGRASLNIQALLRDDIRYAVTSAISESRSARKTVFKEAVRVHTNGDASFLNIVVRPMKDGISVSNVMVVFDEVSIPQKILKEKVGVTISAEDKTRIQALEKELDYTKENLQSTIEELEASNEELTSTNEELQSNNEELQSIGEESETTKEELSSLNEELLTINSELERKNQDLSATSSDLRNLLNSIDEAVVFLDGKLRIKRYTPQTEKIMNLLPGDIGRPIQDIAMNLQYEDLIKDIREVIETLNSKETEVQTKEDRWYLLKIIPYRTIENFIDGVVLVFSDIDEQKKVQEQLRETVSEVQAAREYAESIVNTVKEPLLIMDKDFIVRSANTAFYELFKAKAENIVGRSLNVILNGAWNIPQLFSRLKQLSEKDIEVENVRTEIVLPKSGKKIVEVTVRKVLIPTGKSTMLQLTINEA